MKRWIMFGCIAAAIAFLLSNLPFQTGSPTIGEEGAFLASYWWTIPVGLLATLLGISLLLGRPREGDSSGASKARRWIVRIVAVGVLAYIAYYLYTQYGGEVGIDVDDLGVDGVREGVLGYLASMGAPTFLTLALLLAMLAPIVWTLFLVPGYEKRAGTNVGKYATFLRCYGSAAVGTLLILGFNPANLWYPSMSGALQMFVVGLGTVALLGVALTLSMKLVGAALSLIAMFILLILQILIALGTQQQAAPSRAELSLQDQQAIQRVVQAIVAEAKRENGLDECEPTVTPSTDVSGTWPIEGVCKRILVLCVPIADWDTHRPVYVVQDSSLDAYGIVHTTTKEVSFAEEEYYCSVVRRNGPDADPVQVTIKRPPPKS